MEPNNAQTDALVLVGSPRENGRSAKLAQALAGELRAHGVATTLWPLAQYPVAACNGCGSCSRTGECRIVNDPWHVLSRHMDSADVLFVVAPVYFAGPSGWLKAALDRCQVYWARKYVLHEEMPPMRPAYLCVVGDGGDPFGSQPLETICTSALNCANLRVEEHRIFRFVGEQYDLSRTTGVAEAALREIAGEAAD